jgi:hypothetical protein
MNEPQIKTMLDKINAMLQLKFDYPSLVDPLMAEITQIIYDSWVEEENDTIAEPDEPVKNEGYD